MGPEYSLEHSQRIARSAPIAGRAGLDEIPAALQPVDLMALSAQQLCSGCMEQLIDLFLVFLQDFLRRALCRRLFLSQFTLARPWTDALNSVRPTRIQLLFLYHFVVHDRPETSLHDVWSEAGYPISEADDRPEITSFR